MPCFVGIDEAGYGPNLGPLVQSAVVIHCDETPDDLPRRLRRFLRRLGDPDDGRILIDDSKIVHAGKNGFRRLETSVLGTIPHHRSTDHFRLTQWLGEVARDSCEHLTKEPWFDHNLTLPLEASLDDLARIHQHGRDFCFGAEIRKLEAASVITTPAKFNRCLSAGLNKAQVLGEGLRQLFTILQPRIEAADEVFVVIDRQGGRRFYGEFLRDIFPRTWIQAVCEDEEVSQYRSLQEPITEWSFVVQAEKKNWLVAWASMLSKYIREVAMRQFNRFWQRFLPHLRATAGYPVDARRFLAEIDGLRRRLEIPIDCIWRQK